MSAPGLHHVSGTLLSDAAPHTRTEAVVEETPIALLFNGSAFAVMMATATDLHDYALGFALSEGIVQQAEQLRVLDIVHSGAGISLDCSIDQACFDALGQRQRNLEGRSGCGLCGVQSLPQAMRDIAALADAELARWNHSQLLAGMQHMQAQQPINSASGGAHAAAVLCHDGRLHVREDVGRHNAVDKAVGAAVTASLAMADCALLVTSRASFEIVQKCASVGIGTVIAISAPTSLAISRAQALGVCLAGFARDARMTVYSHAQRISQ